MKNMFIKNKKAFTFVELLMVILVLGIIITLTMPLLNNLKDDDDIYRAYMKKALHDVTDATNMVFLRERYLTDFSENSLAKLCSIYGCSGPGDKYVGCSDSSTCANSTGLRAVYNLLAVPGATCSGDGCFTNGVSAMTNTANDDLLGIKNGSKSVMQFDYDIDPSANPPTYGAVYFDVNGSKKPNAPCQDRYKFIIYLDRVVLDTAYGGACNLEL